MEERGKGRGEEGGGGKEEDEEELRGWWLWRLEKDRRVQALRHGGSVQKDDGRGREERRGKERHQGEKRKSQ